jgi:hypothetical protein
VIFTTPWMLMYLFYGFVFWISSCLWPNLGF